MTENGEQGATPTRSIESGDGSWCRSIASARGGEDRVDLLHHVVRRQPAPAPAEVHRAAGRQEAQADGARGLDLGAEQVAAVGGNT